MRIMTKNANDIESGPITLKIAVENAMKDNKSQKILANENYEIDNEYKHDYDLNACEIQSKLIYFTGRFCERFASDIILTLNNLDAFLHNCKITEQKQWVIGVGIRENGVDHNLFIMNQLERTITNPFGHPNPRECYRKLLAINIQDIPNKNNSGGKRIITLVDIINDIPYFPKDDYPKYLTKKPF